MKELEKVEEERRKEKSGEKDNSRSLERHCQ